MKKTFLYAVSVLLLGGCSLQSVTPANEEYKIDVKPLEQKYVSQGCKERVLEVRNIENYDPVLSRNIYYGVGDYKLFYYSKSNWQDAPIKAIQAALVKSLRRSGIFKDVLSNRSAARSDLILEYGIENFMQYFSSDFKNSDVKVKIHFSLIDAKNSKLLESKSIEASLPSEALDALGGVQALSSALTKVIEESDSWLDFTCKEDRK